jgi:hypothetical protein
MQTTLNVVADRSERRLEPCTRVRQAVADLSGALSRPGSPRLHCRGPRTWADRGLLEWRCGDPSSAASSRWSDGERFTCCRALAGPGPGSAARPAGGGLRGSNCSSRPADHAQRWSVTLLIDGSSSRSPGPCCRGLIKAFTAEDRERQQRLVVMGPKLPRSSTSTSGVGRRRRASSSCSRSRSPFTPAPERCRGRCVAGSSCEACAPGTATGPMCCTASTSWSPRVRPTRSSVRPALASPRCCACSCASTTPARERCCSTASTCATWTGILAARRRSTCSLAR